MKNRPIQLRASQGFTMAVTLIMLLVVTLLVMGSMRGVVVGERASGDYRERSQTIQRAEQALRQGEMALRQTGCATSWNCLTNAQGLNVLTGPVSSPVTAWSVTSGVTPVAVTNAGRYVVEPIGSFTASGRFPSTSCYRWAVTAKAYSSLNASAGTLDANEGAVVQSQVIVCPVT